MDGSDEHIISRSINGRLHSKRIICSGCNKKFGDSIDPVLAKIFILFIHLLGLKNARSVYVEDPEGRQFLRETNSRVKQIKPELDIETKNGLIFLSVSGNEKDVYKLFEKQKQLLLPKGTNPVRLELKRESWSQPPLSTQIRVESSPELCLLLNKMAVEFYAHMGQDTGIIEPLLNRIASLDKELKNVSFVNLKQEVRRFEDNEISHVIVLKKDSAKKVLYCYIELFNLICAVVELRTEYEGPEINFQYRQDAITGEKISREINIDVKLESFKFDFSMDDVSSLVELFCERHQDRLLQETVTKGLDDIMKTLEHEVSAGTIKKEELSNKYLKQSTEFIAYLSVFEFPFAISDMGEDQDDAINYLHSSMRESLYEEFCSVNKKLIGFGIAFTAEGITTEKCVVDSFMKVPVGKRNGERIYKVLCVLKNVENGDIKYIPFRNLFEGLQKVAEEKSKE